MSYFQIYDSNASQSWQTRKYPILRNTVGSNTYMYSPLVFSSNSNGVKNIRSPWIADLVVHPERDLKTDLVCGTQFTNTNPSDFEYWMNSSGLSGDTYMRVISAFSYNGNDYFSTTRASTAQANAQTWAQKYYIGQEYDSSMTGSNGRNAGTYFNLKALSSITNDYTNMYYSSLGLVSIKHSLFTTYTNVSYNYEWFGSNSLPSGHMYNTRFGLNSTAQIIGIQITGNAAPFDFKLNVSYKGGNFVSATNNEDGRSAMYVGSFHDKQFSSRAKSYTLVSPTLTTVMNEPYKCALLSPRSGMIKHFTIQNQNPQYDYFLIDCSNMPLKSMFGTEFSLSGISPPMISLSVYHPSGTVTNYKTSGLKWTNATAKAICLDGTTALKTGTFDLAPMVGSSMSFLSGIGINPAFSIMDISFGISAKSS